jgi:aspartate 1-decarboxylase
MTFRKLLQAKIHRATITCADLHYEGSLTLPPDLLEASGIVPNEAVHIWNVTRGTRVETYAIVGTAGSRDICANGAAAHHLFPGDVVIIATFAYVPQRRILKHKPRLVFVDADNRIVHHGPEVPGPQRRSSANS